MDSNIVKNLKSKLSIDKVIEIMTEDNAEEEQRKKTEKEFRETLEKTNTDGMVSSEEIAKMSELESESSSMNKAKEKTNEIITKAKASFTVLQKTQQDDKDEDEDPFPAEHQFWN